MKHSPSAFVNESEGHTNLLAVVTPNLPAKPDTVISNKVTIKGARQAVQLFGPAQAAVARAVVDSVAEGVIPKDQVDDLCMIVGVFIHWEAEDDKKIYDWNYEAVKIVDRPRPGRRAEHRQGARRHAGRASPVRRRRRGLASGASLTAQTGEPPLAGLRTVVTGASSGIGRAIATAFAAAGARVGIGFCRSADAAQALAASSAAEDHPLLAGGPRHARRLHVDRAATRSPRSSTSTSGSTTPAPTCSPARRDRGRTSASSRR